MNRKLTDMRQNALKDIALTSVKKYAHTTMKYIFILLGLLLNIELFAQGHFSFENTNQYHIIENGDSLSLGWAGGLNQPQFSTIDLNFDGNEDLLVFDRSGNRIIPLLQVNINGTKKYRYAPQYIENFPPIKNWMLLVDYNCDGKKDIFCSAVGSNIGLYKNVSTPDTIKFEWALTTVHILSDYQNGNPPGNLYSFESDVPAILDIDNDGDIDILTFSQGNTIEWHENTASCGIDYQLNTQCWGRFYEGSLNNQLVLNGCIRIKKADFVSPTSNYTNKGLHSGSTLLILDLDGNGLNDIILGDVSYNNAVAAFNTGQADSAFMSSQDTLFPSYNTPVDLNIFPAFFYEDVDFDGKKDLLVAPNMQGARNVNNVLRYKNVGTNTNATFSYQDSAFLQRDMIDLGEGGIPVVADINFDGLTDLFVSNYGKLQKDGNYQSFIKHYKNTGNTNKPAFTLVDDDLANISQLSLGLNLIPAFGDLDGDVDLDMIVGNNDGKLIYFKNTGGITTPAFTYVTDNYQGIDVGNSSAPHLFDLDQDGDLDLFIGEEGGNINFYENDGANPANFTLVTESLGGIDLRSRIFNTGYTIPNFYRRNDTITLFVGSHDLGVVQYDSIANVMALPPQIEQIIGTGTIATTNSDLTPFGTLKRNGRNQMLYRASELNALGFEYGKIVSISFKITNNPTNIVSQGFSIKMKNVNKQSISAWESNMTEVYNYLYPATNGWNDITLSTPFLWDGVSDLLVEVCFSKNFQSQNIPVECTDVGFASNAYGDVSIWNGATQDGCSMPYLTASTIRPNVRLKIIPTFVATDVVVKNGYRNSPAVADLDGDQYIDMIVGNYSGGVSFYRGIEYVAPPMAFNENAFSAQDAMLVYPNPTSNVLYIEVPAEIVLAKAEVRLMDLMGRQIMTKSELEKSTMLNVSSCANGIYILMLSDGKSSYHQRVIIQK